MYTYHTYVVIWCYRDVHSSKVLGRTTSATLPKCPSFFWLFSLHKSCCTWGISSISHTLKQNVQKVTPNATPPLPLNIFNSICMALRNPSLWDPTVWSMGLAGRGLEGIPCCGFARQLPGLVKENWQRYLARLMAVFFFPVISILFENTFCCEIFVQ